MTIWKQNLLHVLRLIRKGKKCAMNKRYLVVRKEPGTIDGVQFISYRKPEEFIRKMGKKLSKNAKFLFTIHVSYDMLIGHANVREAPRDFVFWTFTGRKRSSEGNILKGGTYHAA